MTDIDDSVRDAAELLVREHGVADAIAELQRRADAGHDANTDRALAALSGDFLSHPQMYHPDHAELGKTSRIS
jgi:hypothetical protein